MEKSLFEAIQNDIKKRELHQSVIAKKMKTTATSLHYYLTNENKMKYIQYVEMLRLVYEDDYQSINDKIKIFVESSNKKGNARQCLEWSTHNGQQELFEIALKKEALVGSEETVELYKLLMLRNTGKINTSDLFERVEDFKFNGVKQPENKMLLSILTLYVHLDLREYGSISKLALISLKKIRDIKDEFIQRAYEIRIKEMLAISLLKNGQIERAETVAFDIIENTNSEWFPLPVNSIYSLLAERYVFDNAKLSLKYINKAISMFENLEISGYVNRARMLRATHDFVKITNGIYDKLYLEDDAERAHYYAKTLRSKEALEIIKEIERKGSLSPHQLYYKALATEKREDFKAAEKEFYKRSDMFYCRLVERLVE